MAILNIGYKNSTLIEIHFCLKLLIDRNSKGACIFNSNLILTHQYDLKQCPLVRTGCNLDC